MRTKLFKIAQAATLGIALAFTLSCSDDKDDNNPTSSDSGGGISSPGSGGGSSGGTSSPSNCSLNGEVVTIGTQTWMAENLNCNVEGSNCYNSDPANCDKYGRLYNWSTAHEICPTGWHLPSEAEWTALIAAVGSSTAGTKLKATSGWDDYEGKSGNGTDDYGFAALPGGWFDKNSFGGVGSTSCWWSDTWVDAYSARAWCMYSVSAEAFGGGGVDRGRGYSVRCVQD